jgi:hypothetical protein
VQCVCYASRDSIKLIEISVIDAVYQKRLLMHANVLNTSEECEHRKPISDEWHCILWVTHIDHGPDLFFVQCVLNLNIRYMCSYSILLKRYITGIPFEITGIKLQVQRMHFEE